MHTHTNAHAHAHTRRHADTHRHTHTHTHTHKHTHRHTHTNTEVANFKSSMCVMNNTGQEFDQWPWQRGFEQVWDWGKYYCISYILMSDYRNRDWMLCSVNILFTPRQITLFKYLHQHYLHHFMQNHLWKKRTWMTCFYIWTFLNVIRIIQINKRSSQYDISF